MEGGDTKQHTEQGYISWVFGGGRRTRVLGFVFLLLALCSDRTTASRTAASDQRHLVDSLQEGTRQDKKRPCRLALSCATWEAAVHHMPEGTPTTHSVLRAARSSPPEVVPKHCRAHEVAEELGTGFLQQLLAVWVAWREL